MAVRLSFHGGAGTVTGSKYLLDTGTSRVLIDAGLFQGLKKLRLLNWRPSPFPPESVDAVLLTHAHIDHGGYLPRLVRLGFDNPVYTTPASMDLATLLLLDAAKIQEEDAAFANRKGYSKHRPALPLYTTEDAVAACELMQPVPFGEWLQVREDVRARFLNMGHILGSSMIEVHVTQGGKRARLVFSGDVGRYDVPLHSNPDNLPDCDYLTIESTYGDRVHNHETVEQQIRDALIRAVEREGTILIPSFAVGRTQLVTLSLRNLINEGRLPEVPIHIDSPMAVDATRLYTKHIKDLSIDATVTEDGRSRLFPNNVHFHRSVRESKALNRMPGPRVVISASGMLTAGRVLHHLARLLPDPQNLVTLVGYQAAGTRGRAMIEGAESIKIHGQEIPVRAEFIALSGLSAHADRNELLRWAQSGESTPGTIFVTHGEEKSQQALAQLLSGETGAQCITPELDEEVQIRLS
ncbi:MAG: MBL fold metallo-hydrolase [Gammaproteobacteria bacterium]|nr:MBL fold metallo-hydrolase [Gammaproteobacteria bacterium]NND59737.1 MBL fold metallo-hydrolase [Gammaproteobacteria bacterium]